MSHPEQDLLTTTEGVDEGSAASTAEGPGTGARPPAGGAPHVEGERPAPPDAVDTDASLAAREGQQLEAGEG